MPDRLRVAGWDRVSRVIAVAVLGFALSACGGGAGSSPASAAAPQGSASAQSAGSTGSGSTPSQGTSTGTTAPAGSGSSGTSGSGTSSSGSGGSTPPTASTGNVTINWNPPTQNTDGTPLTDLAGFKIHYGTASQKYTQTITVSNPGLVTYVVTNLAAGTYYFAVTAYSSAGTESTPSSEVSTTVN